MTEDRIEYELEISTKTSNEIKALLSDLDKAESQIYKIKSKKTEREIFRSGGSPVQIEEPEEKTGIFAGEMEGVAYPDKGRDTTSKAPYERANPFKILKEKVEGLEEKEETSSKALNEILGGAVAIGTTAGKGGLLGLFKSQASKLIPFIGEGLIALGFAETIANFMFMDGGPFDRRWKYILTKYVAPFFARALQAKIRQGFADVRISSFIGSHQAVRGQVFTTLQGVRAGRPVYSQNLEQMTKDPTL